MKRFECDKCGACCQGSLIVEADDLDVMREPRLIAGDESQGDRSVEQVVREIQTEGKIVLLACGSPCMFLDSNLRYVKEPCTNDLLMLAQRSATIW